MARRTKNPYKRGDRFTQQARDEGYKARSVFKLAEIQKRFRLLQAGQRVVDLGCFPGSWSQFALQLVGPSGTLVGVDIERPSLAGGTWITRSVYDVTGAGDVVRAVVEGLGVGGGHRSMAKGIIPLKAFREVYKTADRERIRSALYDAFVRAIRREED